MGNRPEQLGEHLKVAIIGAGPIGYGSAVILADRGHRPVIWSPSGASTELIAGGAPVVATGVIDGSFTIEAASDPQTACADATAILIAVPAYAHRFVLDAIGPYLRPEQTLIFTSQLSLSLFYLRGLLSRLGTSVQSCAWGTTLASGVKPKQNEVRFYMRSSVYVADHQTRRRGDGYRLSSSLFGEHFVPAPALQDVIFSNTGGVIHMPLSLANISRIESGETWNGFANTTEAVGNLTEAVDDERLQVAAAYGAHPISIRGHFSNTFGVPEGPVHEMLSSVSKMDLHSAPTSPRSLQTRWINEDIPYAGATLEFLGRLAGVPTPLHTAVIDLFDAMLRRSMRRENNLISDLDLDEIRGLQRAAE